MTHLVEIGGRTIGSGTQGAAIQSVKLTRCVNAGEDLTLGSVCSAMVEISFLELDVPVPVGTDFKLFTQENGEITQVGLFTCQQAQTRGQVTKITAYDRLLRLEQDATLFLKTLKQWPYSLAEFAWRVCDFCNIPLAEEDIPGGELPLYQITGQNVTARTLMQYVGEVAGRFLTADAYGVAHFGWYTPTDTVIAPQGECCCFSDGLKLEPFQVPRVDTVHIRATGEDVGLVYPDHEGYQHYTSTGNPLLMLERELVAPRLYAQLKTVTYTPGQLRVPDTVPVAPGDIITVEDTAGQRHSFYVMELTHQNRALTLTCYGTVHRDGDYSRNYRKLEALEGKVLELTTTTNELSVSNWDMQGTMSNLHLSLLGISSQVSAQTQENTLVRRELTALTQTARALSASVKTVEENGASRVQTQFGLTLDGSALTIARSGSEMVNRLNERGMYVVRTDGADAQTVMLQADADGVVATDVSVRNYLMVGDHARFEDFDTNRTACFYC